MSFPNTRTKASNLRAEIDEMLSIDFVEWKQVYSYTCELDRILETILSFGKKQPAEALELTHYFIREIPRIYNSIHDECELAEFCSDLARAALTVRKKTGGSLQATMELLLRAYLDEVGETCRFDDVPEILAETRWSKDERHELVRLVEERVVAAEERSASELRTLLEKILHPKKSRAQQLRSGALK